MRGIGVPCLTTWLGSKNWETPFAWEMERTKTCGPSPGDLNVTHIDMLGAPWQGMEKGRVKTNGVLVKVTRRQGENG